MNLMTDDAEVIARLKKKGQFDRIIQETGGSGETPNHFVRCVLGNDVYIYFNSPGDNGWACFRDCTPAEIDQILSGLSDDGDQLKTIYPPIKKRQRPVRKVASEGDFFVEAMTRATGLDTDEEKRVLRNMLLATDPRRFSLPPPENYKQLLCDPSFLASVRVWNNAVIRRSVSLPHIFERAALIRSFAEAGDLAAMRALHRYGKG